MHQKNQPVNDEQLVGQTRYTTPVEQFALLYKQYVQKVYQQCLTLTGDSGEAEDFTQDIFLKVFTKVNSFQQRSAFSTWLYALSRNHCLDKIKLSKRLKTELLVNQDMPESSEPVGLVEYQLQQMNSLLEQLPAQELTLLKLRHEQGISIREIAQRYNMNESTIKMRLKRSRDRLKAQYSHYRY